MNLSREEAQQILGTLEDHPGNYKLNTEEAKKHGIVVDFLQSRLEEPDAGANVEFPTPAYLRVSDDPVDISIIDYYTESQLRSYADARVAAARLAEGEQEPVAWMDKFGGLRLHTEMNWRLDRLDNWTPLFAAPQGATK